MEYLSWANKAKSFMHPVTMAAGVNKGTIAFVNKGGTTLITATHVMISTANAAAAVFSFGVADASSAAMIAHSLTAGAAVDVGVCQKVGSVNASEIGAATADTADAISVFAERFVSRRGYDGRDILLEIPQGIDLSALNSALVVQCGVNAVAYSATLFTLDRPLAV